ncbi:hypothetical protein GCM10008014_22240 [Paenibacillus silvae]|uniref:Uncharacterized protein n=1 Tax=Paenibacillus silvae TaxID=1325358 RepID=A0ABQ1Z8U3_9BACL|nr:hypothetical protein GCM10008014_22240 [Paenibacillus silvae]
MALWRLGRTNYTVRMIDTCDSYAGVGENIFIDIATVMQMLVNPRYNLSVSVSLTISDDLTCRVLNVLEL